MLTLKMSELKAQSADELRRTLDRAMAAMLYPHDDPSHKDGDFLTLDIVDDLGTTARGGAGNLVALRYIWFLYKKATIPGYTGQDMRSWYE